MVESSNCRLVQGAAVFDKQRKALTTRTAVHLHERQRNLAFSSYREALARCFFTDVVATCITLDSTCAARIRATRTGRNVNSELAALYDHLFLSARPVRAATYAH